MYTSALLCTFEVNERALDQKNEIIVQASLLYTVTEIQKTTCWLLYNFNQKPHYKRVIKQFLARFFFALFRNHRLNFRNDSLTLKKVCYSIFLYFMNFFFSKTNLIIKKIRIFAK